MNVLFDWSAFSGYTTQWQAISRGLPIVTLAGAFVRQRLAPGLLRDIGQGGGIAQNESDYVVQAVSLADNADVRMSTRGCIKR